MKKPKWRISLDKDHEVRVGNNDAQRKDLRKTAKRLIKVAKKHPNLWTREDVMYAKLIKRQNKKIKKSDGNDSN
jgi:hypothetical protein|tara:strand:+ start:424 stop:645 length:222 start_codon:yes stop_codon:yes gene_type:complete